MVKDEDSSQHVIDYNEFFRDFLSAGISAAFAKTLGAPIERVKLILQVQEANQQLQESKQYRGILNALVRIPREQGILSMWRGNFINLLRYFPLQALNFAFKDIYRDLLVKDINRNEHFWKFFFGNMVAGGAAGGTSLIFVYPLDYARTRLSVDIGRNTKERVYSNFTECIVSTYRTDGIRGLYRGFVISFQGAMIYRAGYFGFYDTAMSFLPNPDRTPFIVTFVIAQTVTFVSALISYPFDVVSRQLMMMSGLPESERIYRNTMDCWVKLYRHHGARAFFQGAIANMFRGIGSGIVLILHPVVKRILFDEVT